MATTSDTTALRNRFPEFRLVGDPILAANYNTADMLLGSGSNWVSQTDFQNARLFLAAHLMMLGQMGAFMLGGIGVGGMGLFISQIRFGERVVDFDERALFKVMSGTLGEGEMMFNMTFYGQMFLQLRARNIIPIAVV